MGEPGRTTTPRRGRPPWPPGRARYLLLSVVVVALVAGQDLNEQWSGDVWLHASAVREMARRPFGALDPVLGIDVAHPMLTPYTWVLGRVSAWTGATALTTLKAAALVNVVLLLVGLRAFTLAVLAPQGAPEQAARRLDLIPGDERAASWALLFTLCLWGPSPWRWSGLLHVGALGFTSPYPSLFATGAALLVLALALRRAPHGPGWWVVGVAAAVPAIALTHPPTAGALAIGLVAVAVRWRRALGGRGLALVASAAGVGALVTLAWPEYSLLALEPTPSFDAMHELIYQQTLVRIAPALLGLVPLGWRWWRQRDDALVLMAGASLAFVVVGATTGPLWLGRLLPFGVLCLHVALAQVAAAGERWPTHRRTVAATAVVATVVLVAWGLVNGRAAVVRSLPRPLVPAAVRDDERLDAASATYGPLLEGVGPDDVVVAPFTDSRYVPAFAGRLVGSYWENSAVPDDAERRGRVALVYQGSDAARRRALAGVQWVVTSPEGRIDDQLRADGWSSVREVGDLALWHRPGP